MTTRDPMAGFEMPTSSYESKELTPPGIGQLSLRLATAVETVPGRVGASGRDVPARDRGAPGPQRPPGRGSLVEVGDRRWPNLGLRGYIEEVRVVPTDVGEAIGDMCGDE